VHKLRVIRFLVCLSAAALPFAAALLLPRVANAAEAATKDAANAAKPAPPARTSQLPKMSFDGQPQSEPPSKSPGESKPDSAPKERPKKTPAPDEKPAPEQGESSKTGQPSPLSIPFVEGYDSLGLKIPDFDPVSGALKSWYSIGTLRRLDDKIVELRDSYLELYKTDGSKEVSMDLPKASLDRFTRKLESKVPVFIWSDDFHITGATMELDTVSKEASLGGPVHVLIYQFKDDPSAEENEEEARNAPNRANASGGATQGEPPAGETNGAAAVKGEKIN
jgi:hypothetical protein